MNLKKDPLMSAISEELWLPSIEKEIDRYTKKLVSRMPRYGFTETYNEIFQDFYKYSFEDTSKEMHPYYPYPIKHRES